MSSLTWNMSRNSSKPFHFYHFLCNELNWYQSINSWPSYQLWQMSDDYYHQWLCYPKKPRLFVPILFSWLKSCAVAVFVKCIGTSFGYTNLLISNFLLQFLRLIGICILALLNFQYAKMLCQTHFAFAVSSFF